MAVNLSSAEQAIISELKISADEAKAFLSIVMKGKMDALQLELAEMTVEGRAGGGLVTVALSGKGEMKGVKIEDAGEGTEGFAKFRITL